MFHKYLQIPKDVLEDHHAQLQKAQQVVDNDPKRIWNCDETGWSKDQQSRRKVIAKKGRHRVTHTSLYTTEHISAEICSNADGEIMPTMVNLCHLRYVSKSMYSNSQ